MGRFVPHPPNLGVCGWQVFNRSYLVFLPHLASRLFQQNLPPRPYQTNLATYYYLFGNNHWQHRWWIFVVMVHTYGLVAIPRAESLYADICLLRGADSYR